MEKKEKLIKNIKKHSKDLWLPNNDIVFNKIENNSWFDINYYKSPKTIFNNKLKLKTVKTTEKMFCKKITVAFTKEQKQIINRWFNATTLLYNETINFIKNNPDNNDRLNYKKLRTYYLKDIRNNIIQKSQVESINKNTKIYTHIMDCAIKSACAMYKSAITNFKNGYIRHFRIRKLKHSRANKVMEIEPVYFNYKGVVSLCPKIFDDIKYYYNNKEYKLTTISNACNLQYNTKLDKYYLFIPQLHTSVENIRPKEVISIDPGIRTFMTCITENEVIQFDNTTERIKEEIEKKDYINNLKCKKKVKKKIETRSNNRIHNLVTELHWKTIKYLTDNYKVILIGNLSTNGIVNNKTSKITKITKRLAYALSFYKFRQRLEYKSNIKGNKCVIVDESYTSKVCSSCGNCKEDLGSNKVYECNKCKIILDRDVNGSRCIYMVNH